MPQEVKGGSVKKTAIRFLGAILVMALFAGGLTGCGNRSEGQGAAEAAKAFIMADEPATQEIVVSEGGWIVLSATIVNVSDQEVDVRDIPVAASWVDPIERRPLSGVKEIGMWDDRGQNFGPALFGEDMEEATAPTVSKGGRMHGSFLVPPKGVKRVSVMLQLAASTATSPGFKEGDKFKVSIDTSNVRVFDAVTGVRMPVDGEAKSGVRIFAPLPVHRSQGVV